MQETHDQAVVDALSTIQAQLNTINSTLQSTPTPGFSSNLYAVSAVSPTIDLEVQHIVTVGDITSSALVVVLLVVVLLKVIFNGLRGNSL